MEELLLGAALEGIGLGKPQIPLDGEQVNPFLHLVHQRGGQRHVKGLAGLAAPGVQAVKGGVLLTGFQTLFLLRVPAGLEQQGVGAVPEEAAGFAVGGQGEGLSFPGL